MQENLISRIYIIVEPDIKLFDIPSIINFLRLHQHNIGNLSNLWKRSQMENLYK